MGQRTESITEFRVKRLQQSIQRATGTTQYTAGDVISAVTTNNHFAFTGVTRTGKLTGSIDAARCFSSANQSTLPDLELWLFHTDIAEVADNGAFAPTDAELLTLVGIIDFPVADWKVGLSGSGANGNAVCDVHNIAIPFHLKTVGDLYGQLVVRNAYTPVDSEIFTVELVVSQD